MTGSKRLSIAFSIVLGATLLLPSAALATPSEDSCAYLRDVPFAYDAPAAFRTPGTHEFEWRTTFTDADGTHVDEILANQITIDLTAESYPNAVLLRLFRNTTLLGNGEVVAVDAMRPEQRATFRVDAYGLKDEPFVATFRLWLRYETAPGVWSAWVELRRGPESSLCSQVNSGTFKRTYGWQ